MKVVLADRIAILVDTVYGDYITFGGYYLIVATILFAVQIYCDFAGYSIIAMGGFYKRVLEGMAVDYELLFINDGSKDHTSDILRRLNREDYHVCYLSFSSHFRKEAAIYAGFCNVCGDYDGTGFLFGRGDR